MCVRSMVNCCKAQSKQKEKHEETKSRRAGKTVCNCSRDDDLDTGEELPINALSEPTNENLNQQTGILRPDGQGEVRAAATYIIGLSSES